MKKIILILSLLSIISCDFIDKFYSSYAIELAEEKVRDNLKHHKSIKFSNIENTQVIEKVYRSLKGYEINGYVDAELVSGETSRIFYTIEIYHNPDLDSYKFKNFTLTENREIGSKSII